MSKDEEEDKTIYKVVVNHEEQYSIWFADRDLPLGWYETGNGGLKAQCLAYIKEVWTDMRPLSLRKTHGSSGPTGKPGVERTLLRKDYMRKYCKAYYLKDLRVFSGWSEMPDGDAELAEDAIVYLWDDFTVVKSPVISQEGLLFDTITPEWQNFCTTNLHFHIPEEQSEKPISGSSEQHRTPI